MTNNTESRLTEFATIFLRLALAAGFLAAVSDRFGLWGPPGTTNVAWGDFDHFLAYAAKLNPELPVSWIPVVGWTVTFAETVFAIMLLLGFHTRTFALLSGIVLLAFASGMTIGTGVKSALNASVFSASAGAFLLSTMREYSLSLDASRKSIQREKLTSVLLGVVLMPVTSLSFAQNKKNAKKEQEPRSESKKTEQSMSIREKNIEVMLKLFGAVERHDEQQQIALPNVEFHWPPSLYGGSRPGWDETWLPLQPTAAERRMDPRIVAANENEVVVLWHQRGVSPKGERFDGEVLGLYKLSDGKLACAQMFYFDPAAVASFLARAITPELQRRVHAVLSRLKGLPDARRRKVEQAYGALQMMAPDQRQQVITSDEFKSAFSDNERDLLNSILDLNSSHGERRPEG